MWVKNFKMILEIMLLIYKIKDKEKHILIIGMEFDPNNYSNLVEWIRIENILRYKHQDFVEFLSMATDIFG